MYEAFEQIVTSPPMPRMPSSDSDSDDVDSSLGLVLDRSATSSTASMEPMERLEGLQRVNADLSKKLVEADPRCNANSRITRVNWRRWKRAAKRQSPTQCGEMRREGAEELRTFEPDADRFPGERDCQGPKDPRQLPQNVQFVTKATKRNCNVLIRYVVSDEPDDLRNTLCRKDEMWNCRERQMETSKFLKENEAYKEQVVLLEQDLGLAQQAQTSLDEQKEKNSCSKRLSIASDSTGSSSLPGSVNRSLDSAATMKELGIENPGKKTDDRDNHSQEAKPIKSNLWLWRISGNPYRLIRRANRHLAQLYIYTDRRPHTTRYDGGGDSGRQNYRLPFTLAPRRRQGARFVVIHRPLPTLKANPASLDPLAVNSPTDLPPFYNQVASEISFHDLLHLLNLSFAAHIPDPRKRRDLRVERPQAPSASMRRCVSRDVRRVARTAAQVLKAEVGIGCKVIDRMLEDAATTINTCYTPTGRLQKRIRFYNIYNPYVYGGGNSVAS
ncbi:hypothetical protein V8E53_015195 [Lactarius tabidus]